MFRLAILLVLLVMNLFALWALRGSVAWWIAPKLRRGANRWMGWVVLLLNLPLLVSFLPRLSSVLGIFPPGLLRIFFYPSSVWLATILAFFVIGVSAGLLIILARIMYRYARMASLRISRFFKSKAEQTSPAKRFLAVETSDSSRRSFLVGAPGMLIPAIYSAAAYGLFAGLGEIDISQEYSIPVAHLPRPLEGLTIVQLSDLHVGPYIRDRELQHVVELANQLHPDLVVITGDILDRNLSSLPDAVNGLKGIRAPLGTFAVLGNHDYYADRYSYSGSRRGGFRISKGLDSIGIRTLRNEVVQLGTGPDRLALMGLDWLTSSPSDRSFFSYKAVETRRELARMSEVAGPETPRILLAHHPDTFMDAPDAGVALTLSGHTHGGGQVILANVGGTPIGLAMLRFKYLSGLYQERGSSAYVNRGIGYLGIPLRINCPPEISRFKLVQQITTNT